MRQRAEGQVVEEPVMASIEDSGRAGEIEYGTGCSASALFL